MGTGWACRVTDGKGGVGRDKGGVKVEVGLRKGRRMGETEENVGEVDARRKTAGGQPAGDILNRIAGPTSGRGAIANWEPKFIPGVFVIEIRGSRGVQCSLCCARGNGRQGGTSSDASALSFIPTHS
eukprot:2061795-Rhodomonas_salina.1